MNFLFKNSSLEEDVTGVRAVTVSCLILSYPIGGYEVKNLHTMAYLRIPKIHVHSANQPTFYVVNFVIASYPEQYRVWGVLKDVKKF